MNRILLCKLKSNKINIQNFHRFFWPILLLVNFPSSKVSIFGFLYLLLFYFQVRYFDDDEIVGEASKFWEMKIYWSIGLLDLVESKRNLSSLYLLLQE